MIQPSLGIYWYLNISLPPSKSPVLKPREGIPGREWLPLLCYLPKSEKIHFSGILSISHLPHSELLF